LYVIHGMCKFAIRLEICYALERFMPISHTSHFY